MENGDIQTGSHKKILILFITGFVILVIGGIVWYTINRNTSNSSAIVPRDTDGDLLSDVDEAKIGTDPKKVDTDNDGLSDYEEVQLKTDPKNAHSISPNMLDGEAVLDQQATQVQSTLNERVLKLKAKKQ